MSHSHWDSGISHCAQRYLAWLVPVDIEEMLALRRPGGKRAVGNVADKAAVALINLMVRWKPRPFETGREAAFQTSSRGALSNGDLAKRESRIQSGAI